MNVTTVIQKINETMAAAHGATIRHRNRELLAAVVDPDDSDGQRCLQQAIDEYNADGQTPFVASIKFVEDVSSSGGHFAVDLELKHMLLH